MQRTIKRNAAMDKILRRTDTKPATGLFIFCCFFLNACSPTVKVQAPQEPITINLNIKLDADVRVKLQEEAKKDIEANPDLF
jgi:hypothetical protein